MKQEDAHHLIAQIFSLVPDVRYVAIYRGGELTSRQREDVHGASASESDRYEELLVNPALLTLATQRGNIDCGGLRFLIVAYGNFYQVVRAYQDGHVSICIEQSADPLLVESHVSRILSR